MVCVNNVLSEINLRVITKQLHIAISNTTNEFTFVWMTGKLLLLQLYVHILIPIS